MRSFGVSAFALDRECGASLRESLGLAARGKTPPPGEMRFSIIVSAHDDLGFRRVASGSSKL